MSDRAISAVRVRRVDGPPLVAVRVSLPGGARLEDRAGLGLLAGRMLVEGTGRRDWSRIAAEAESLGMVLHATAGWDSTQVLVEALAGDWEIALEWAAELTLESTFPAARVAWQARQTAAELASLAELGDVRAGWAFARQLYGDHPRGRPLQGEAEALPGIESAHCSAFHCRALAQGAVVAVAGRIDEEAVRLKVESLFGGQDRPPPALDADPAPPPPGESSTQPAWQETLLPEGEQAHVYLGRLTVRRGDPQVPALLLLGTVLGSGAGLTGRVPYRVREEEGLAYSAEVSTVGGAGLDPGRFEIYLGTSPDSVERAIECVRDELVRVVESGIGDDEIEPARAYLLGRLPFARETAAQWSALLTEAELYGLPLDRPGWVEERLRAVDLAEVERVAGRLLDPAELRITIGRPSS
jgi:zinc protease